MVKFLTQNGATHFEVKDEDEETSLQLSAMNGHVEVVRVLIDAGVDVNETSIFSKEFHVWANNRNSPVRKEIEITPLHLAATNGHGHVVKLLLERGANTLKQDGTSLEYWLQSAVNDDEIEFTKEEREKTIQDAKEILRKRSKATKEICKNDNEIAGRHSLPDCLIDLILEYAHLPRP